MGRGIDILGTLTRVRPERVARRLDGAQLQTVLIVKLSSIGDVVHALPVASALKQSFPHLRITWAVERWTAVLVEGHPAVDRVVVFPTMVKWPEHVGRWRADFCAALSALRDERYDVALDLQGLARSAMVSWLSRAPIRIARAGQREGAHLVSDAVPLPAREIHAVDEYLEVARSLGATVAPAQFALPVRAEARDSVDQLLTAHGVSAARPLIVISPSASVRWREWPLERWRAVVDALAERGTVIIIGERARSAAHRGLIQGAPSAVDLTGQTTLAEVVALIERAALLLAPDTGSAHVAVALGVPVLEVLGPTSSRRAGPYRPPALAISHGERCEWACPTVCLHRHRCLSAVTVEEVVAGAEQLLRQQAI